MFVTRRAKHAPARSPHRQALATRPSGAKALRNVETRNVAAKARPTMPTRDLSGVHECEPATAGEIFPAQGASHGYQSFPKVSPNGAKESSLLRAVLFRPSRAELPPCFFPGARAPGYSSSAPSALQSLETQAHGCVTGMSAVRGFSSAASSLKSTPMLNAPA